MKKSKPLLAIGAALTLAAVAAIAADQVVSQKNRKFSADTLKVKAGETVTFRNDDPFFHNIFSLTEGQSFDLGSYPKGQTRTRKFDKPGKVEVECAIHPEMKMVIEVVK